MPDTKQYTQSLATTTTLPDSPMAMPEQLLETPTEIRPGMSWLTVLVALVGWRVHG